jgi:hypothetical protein
MYHPIDTTKFNIIKKNILLEHDGSYESCTSHSKNYGEYEDIIFDFQTSNSEYEMMEINFKINVPKDVKKIMLSYIPDKISNLRFIPIDENKKCVAKLVINNYIVTDVPPFMEIYTMFNVFNDHKFKFHLEVENCETIYYDGHVFSSNCYFSLEKSLSTNRLLCDAMFEYYYYSSDYNNRIIINYDCSKWSKY